MPQTVLSIHSLLLVEVVEVVEDANVAVVVVAAAVAHSTCVADAVVPHTPQHRIVPEEVAEPVVAPPPPKKKKADDCRCFHSGVSLYCPCWNHHRLDQRHRQVQG